MQVVYLNSNNIIFLINNKIKKKHIAVLDYVLCVDILTLTEFEPIYDVSTHTSTDTLLLEDLA